MPSAVRPPPSIPTLETARLRLRPFVPDDAGTVTELLDDSRVSATLEGIPFPYRRVHADGWIAAHATVFAERRELHLAIERRAPPELLGAIALLPREGGAIHLGYWLGRRHWGRGYATEAVRELLRHAADELHVTQVSARCMTENAASRAVLLKAGLQLVGPGDPIVKDGVSHAVELFEVELERRAGARTAGPDA